MVCCDGSRQMPVHDLGLHDDQTMLSRVDCDDLVPALHGQDNATIDGGRSRRNDLAGARPVSRWPLSRWPLSPNWQRRARR